MLTKKQIEILKVIYQYIQANSISPAVRNIADLAGVKSSATVHRHLGILENEGYITKKDTIPRSIVVTEKGIALLENSEEKR